jgi:hypothetical protein
MRNTVLASAFAITLVTTGVYALATGDMIGFQPGTPIMSSELNQNFKTLKDGLTALEARANWTLPLKLVNDNRGAVLSATNSNAQQGATGLFGTAGGASGLSTETKAGVWGDSASGFGVFASSKDNDGVRGISLNGMGVHGNSPNRFGVYGESLAGKGVYGSTKAGIGVHGASSEGAGITGTSNSGRAAYFEGGAGGRGHCTYDGGAGWNCTSDKNAKEHFRTVDATAVLESLATMPISRWSMKGDRARASHLGPTAQDFKAAFGLGVGDTTINTADAQGVALTAIKGLYFENQKLQREVRALKASVAEQASFQERLSKLERRLK